MILLEDVDTEFGNIRILRSRSDGSHTYYQEKCFHSQANAEGVSTCPYVHVMESVIRQSEAQRVLMIGCAGGTLATMLHRRGHVVTVVDINAYAFTIARRYFQLPPEVTCVADDGAAYVRQTDQRFDAIALDAFDSDGALPPQLIGEDFFRAARACLSPRGIVVMNVMTKHDRDLRADRIASSMEAVGLPSALYDWPGTKDRNTIITGGVAKTIRIPSGQEPKWIRRELEGLVCRKAKELMPRG